jgi:hypothetical protein
VNLGFRGKADVRPFSSPRRFITRQRLSHIRLGNPELSTNPRWSDTSFEGSADRVQIPLRQWQRNFFGPFFTPWLI